MVQRGREAGAQKQRGAIENGIEIGKAKT